MRIISHIINKGDFDTWDIVQNYYIEKGYRWRYQKFGKKWTSEYLISRDLLIVINLYDTDEMRVFYNRLDKDWNDYNIQPTPICNYIPKDMFEL